MPTGYTAAVQNGEITEFSEFAMSCARAFGACVTMRDEPSNAAIPEAFEPSDYNAKRMTEAQAEIDRLQRLSEDETTAEAQKAFEEAAASWDDYERRKAEWTARYEAMLAKVQAWTAPTPEHTGLKTFMVNQLQESIKFDGGPPYRGRPTLQAAGQWFAEALQKARDDLAYHTKAYGEEVERTKQRNEWLRALRSSLGLQK
jgi:hypothetical protein